MSNKYFYPLTKQNFSNSDMSEAQKILNNKKITMGTVTKKLENKFSSYIGQNSLMVNSGSSANLLIFQLLINPIVKLLKSEDEVLISSICWSTSLWPIIQSNLKPVFVDIDCATLNISLNDLEKKITKKTKALMLVHALGNCSNMNKIRIFCKRNNLILIEDTCEALGSEYRGKKLGTFGDFSSFSMYYSHHITSGEGGFISFKKRKYMNLFKVLRSHGWAKEISNASVNNWKFINSGFNVRPTDINASIGLNQLKRVKSILKVRKSNYKLICDNLQNISNFNKYFKIIKEDNNNNIYWFGVAIQLKEKYVKKKIKILNYLNSKGIETRPIISGNFSNQPASKLYKIKSSSLKNANYIERSTFFIGIHNKTLKINEINKFKKIFSLINL